MALSTHHLDARPDFDEIGVPPDLVAILEQQGITRPFPIQALTIPDAMAGSDVCGKAKTGSGKTLAFGLPLVHRMRPARPGHPVALILVPTRELCVQVAEALTPFVEARDGSLLAVYGGVPLRKQVDAVRRGVEVLVATPGRLIDLLDRRSVALDQVATLVIDEADEMADMGFLPQVQVIMRAVDGPHQTMLFSATLDHRVTILVRNYMDDPVFHEVASSTTTVETSDHRFLEVHRMDKPEVTARIARTSRRTLVFVRTKRGCDTVARRLRDLGLDARAIHGDLDQKQRSRALASFTTGRSPVLVATNVAARGLDIEGVDVVVHYDAPEDSTTYLHRSGRTARAGEAGLVVTLVEWDQLHTVRRIQKEAGLEMPIVRMFSNDERLDDLAGWEPPTVASKPTQVRPGRSSARSRRRNRLL